MRRLRELHQHCGIQHCRNFQHGSIGRDRKISLLHKPCGELQRFAGATVLVRSGSGAHQWRIEIDIYYDAVLGDEKSAIEQCQYGGLEFARINISPMCEFVDDLNALSMTYIYKNDEHFWKVAETLGMDILRSR